ncbi:hypothetical protein [Pseudomonas sp. PNP]|uniref:hypothetical protein n=1 Tax=Pseudomonas sp. PNP TaxID=361819 RepID=UPI001AEC9255|nr:hypothetical protein [Pseudomonas sp. PNP]MBP2839275.1 hypothetical protein [Pseudomonas sp. PNP]
MLKHTTAILAAMTLAACSKGFMGEHATSFSENSQKAPQTYAQCLEPHWQAPGTTTSRIQTPTGYTVEVSATHIGPIALAVISKQASGSHVEVFVPTAQGRAERWQDAAQACL